MLPFKWAVFCPPSAPCAPESVETTLSCNTSAVEVSWVLGGAGLNYNATVSTGGFTALSCSSESSGCIVEGLDCGQEYTVTVTAGNSYCTGSTSAPQTIETGMSPAYVCVLVFMDCIFNAV